MFRVFISILLTLISFVYCDSEVKINLGTVRGFKEKFDDEKEVNVFLGVPFAEPPLGSKRFQKPHPLKKKFNKTLEANSWPKMCMQAGKGEFSEDCLYLNIWSPIDLSSKFTKNSKPVMVFFPGGAFIEGGISKEEFNASKLAAFGDVVVVTVNYRLGALGFLYGGNKDIPGNMGLYDQLLALHWVNENIEHFGGDKNAITIFGHSAGAMSVSLHLISPLSQPLFKNAIVMSGVAMEYFIAESEITEFEKALALARLVGCDITSKHNWLDKSTIQCLRKIDANKLIKAQSSPSILKGKRNPFMIPFLPIFGDPLIPIESKKAWIDSNFRNDSNLLIGTVPNDGIVAYNLASRYMKTTHFIHSFIKIAEEYFDNFMTSAIPPITNDIMKIYFRNLTKLDNRKSEKAFYHALSDILFNCPSSKLAVEFAKSNTAYQYLFDYQGSVGARCKGFGPCHGEEIRFTFGTTQHEKDNKISLRWMKVLSEFARTGTVPVSKYEKTDSNFSLPFFYHFTGIENEAKDEIGYRYLFCDYWNKIIFENLL